MGVIFDSSEIIALERDRAEAESLVVGRPDEPFGISVVTVTELLHGVERADTEGRRIRRQAFVEKVLELFPVFPFDTSAARIHARIWASLARRGQTVGAHDLIIAATAISLDYARRHPQPQGLRAGRGAQGRGALRGARSFPPPAWPRSSRSKTCKPRSGPTPCGRRPRSAETRSNGRSSSWQRRERRTTWSHGRLAGCHTVRLTYSCRVTLTLLVSERAITLLDIGSHDGVCR